MADYKKLIFVCMDNMLRSPVAEALMKNLSPVGDLQVISRGLIVLFSEPYNPKARALLMGRDIILGNGSSIQLSGEDITPDTLILTMDKEEKNKLSEEFPEAENVYTIMEFAGENGDIIDPYGGSGEVYNLFFESISKWVCAVHDILKELKKET